jgi:hypothetical protein
MIYFSTSAVTANASITFSLPPAYAAGDGGSAEYVVAVMVDFATQPNTSVSLSVTQGGNTLTTVTTSNFAPNGTALALLGPNPAAGPLVLVNNGPATISCVSISDSFGRGTGS